MLLVGPNLDSLRFEFDDFVSVASEPDGLRVIVSGGTLDFISQVPAALVEVRAIGSTSPAALLFDAHTAFSKSDARCDEIVRELYGGDGGGAALVEAVSGCLAAAQSEWDPEEQAALLRAAAYGKAFDPGAFARDAFPAAARALRVLNSLRDPDVGLPLTSAQLTELTIPVLLDRLLSRNAHRLALALAGFMGTQADRDRALVHWACAKVRASRGMPDEALAALVGSRLANARSVSYADIAAAADAAGRRVLATLLLDKEPSAAFRVPILLRMRERRLALEKALESGDGDLTHLVIATLRKACAAEGEAGAGIGAGGDGEDGSSGGGGAPGVDPQDSDAVFLRVILAYPAAVDSTVAWARATQDSALLVKTLLAAGRWAAAGKALIEAAFASGMEEGENGDEGEALKARIAGFRKAVELLKDGEKAPRASASEKHECAVLRGATEDAVSLLLAQVGLERELREARVSTASALVDTSLAETLGALVELGDPWAKRAEKLAKDQKLPDAAWVRIKARALARIRDWTALGDFAAKNQSSGGGWAAFARVAAAHGGAIESRKFALKIADYNERIELLLKLGAVGEAVDVARAAKDVDRLISLQDAPGHTTTSQDALAKALNALTGGKAR